jgi:lysozyme
VKHEGLKSYPYLDSSQPPNITIGIGYNLSARGMDMEWINKQFQSDIEYFDHQLTINFEWYSQLTMERRIVLIDMAFMGWKKFVTFNRMLTALEAFDYDLAADEMLNSKWAGQVKGRANELALAMRTGVYDV